MTMCKETKTSVAALVQTLAIIYHDLISVSTQSNINIENGSCNLPSIFPSSLCSYCAVYIMRTHQCMVIIYIYLYYAYKTKECRLLLCFVHCLLELMNIL